MTGYDSRIDTFEHREHVQRFVLRIVHCLLERAIVHDASKMVEPERSTFDAMAPRLSGMEYGSEEYRTALREMKEALRHHYAQNPHHPEHYSTGVRGMSLVDLVEMLCDWKAAGLRHATNAGLAASIQYNQERFGYSDELRDILLNTAVLMENGDEATRHAAT